ncbi:MAG TPA: M23 family metallopeptidase [Methylomirabilota bacterium]|nr:M23 family metallopeptidase [Methylomirabilota bacterium]
MRSLVRLLACGGLGLVIVLAWASRPIDPAPPLTITAPAGEGPAPTISAETTLRHRETLEAVLVRSGLERADATVVVGLLRGVVDMRRLAPGERLLVTRDAADAVMGITYWRSPIERYELSRAERGWALQAVRVPVETRIALVKGRLEDSLFASMDRLGEGAALTVAFVSLFEWDFDFAADSLPGDRFRLLVEKRFGENQFLGYGEILVAQYRSADRPRLTTVSFTDAQGRGAYYDASGRSVKKMFLRAPLDFTRITSGFSHARLHPVLGGVRPHLAIDYGAPTGTPVRAVADGTVIASGWNGGNGISVTIRHTRGYETMYNHLSAATVRVGERVRQRAIIGRVGATGLATGPHLDYRVKKDGQFVNPLGERFFPGEPVSARRKAAFDRHLEALLERLEREDAQPDSSPGS